MPCLAFCCAVHLFACQHSGDVSISDLQDEMSPANIFSFGDCCVYCGLMSWVCDADVVVLPVVVVLARWAIMGYRICGCVYTSQFKREYAGVCRAMVMGAPTANAVI